MARCRRAKHDSARAIRRRPGGRSSTSAPGIRFTQKDVVHNVSLHLDNAFNRVYRDNLSVIKDFVPQPGRGVRLNYELMY